MTAIVGNSKNIKMVQHYLMLSASRGLKGDTSSAKSAMTSARAVLDTIKMNRSLFRNQFVAALVLESTLALSDAETLIKRAD